jgi:Zn-dependent protease
MSDTLFQALALIIPLVIAIVFHEVAHGWVARALGDPTAAEQNRLSLNPVRHVDPMGTIILPGILALLKAPILGWAKPVPVNKWRLRNPRFGMMAVAAAGPGSNLLLGVIGAVLLGLVLRGQAGIEGTSVGTAFLAANLANFLMINVFLAFFNLLPIPPFDGSHIVEGLLPRAMAARYARMRRFGFSLVLLLFIALPWFFPSLNLVERYILPPVEWMVGHYVDLARSVAGV